MIFYMWSFVIHVGKEYTIHDVTWIPIRNGKKPTTTKRQRTNAASSPGEDGEAGPVVSLAVLAPSQPGEKRRGSKVGSKWGPYKLVINGGFESPFFCRAKWISSCTKLLLSAICYTGVS